MSPRRHVHEHHADPGLQPERTSLSWGRTVLALGVVSLAFLRWYGHVGGWALVPAASALAVGAVLLLGQRRRYARGSSGILRERVRPATLGVGGLSAAVAALAVLGVAVTLLTSRP